MFPKQDIAKPRTPEDVVRAYGLKHEDKSLVEAHIKVGDTILTESQLKKLLALLQK